jgi:AhpD family alkylhydroperoxidase
MIPNLAAAMAESPTLVRSFFTVRDIYAQGSMDPIDIQVLSLTNAFENGCEWCMAFHSAAALKEGLSKEDVWRLRAGQAPADARLQALSNFSRSMVRNRGAVSAQDLEAFYAAGFTKAQALEVVLGAGFSVMANFAGHLAHAPLGLPFEPHVWTKPEGSAGDRTARTAPVQTAPLPG